MKAKFECLFLKAMILITIVMTGIILFDALNTFPYHKTYLYSYTSLPILSIKLILGVIVLFLFFLAAARFLNQLSNARIHRLLTVCGFLFLLIIQLLMLIFFPHIMYSSDSSNSFYYIYQLVTGSIDQIDTSSGYWSYFGNQYFFVLYMKLLIQGIQAVTFHQLSVTMIANVINVLSIDLGVLFTYLLVRRIFGIRRANLLLLLCIFNPLIYVYSFWVYTSPLSLPTLSGSIYLYYLVYQELKSKTSTRRLVLLSICAAFVTILGIKLRVTLIIPIIAIGIAILFRRSIRDLKNKRVLLSAGIFAVTSLLLYGVFTSGANAIVTDRSNNFPFTHWVMMGLEGDGITNVETVTYTNSYKTKEEKVAANLARIKEDLDNYTIPTFLTHLVRKLPITWSDGTDRFVSRLRQGIESPKILNYISGEKNDLFLLYCQIYRCVLLLCILLNLFQCFRQKAFHLNSALILAFLGAMLFYLIWEAKQDYNLAFTFLMTLLQFYALNIQADRTLPNVFQKKFVRPVSSAVFILCMLAVMISQFSSYTQTNAYWNDYSISNNVRTAQKSEFLGQNKLTETFTADKSFNCIGLSLSASGSGNDRYVFALCQDKEILYQETFTSDKITASGSAFFQFDSQKPGDYFIAIKKAGTGTGNIKFTLRLLQYELKENSTLYLDQTKTPLFNLSFSVSYLSKAPYWSVPVYCMICFVLLLITGFVLAFSLQTSRQSTKGSADERLH